MIEMGPSLRLTTYRQLRALSVAGLSARSEQMENPGVDIENGYICPCQSILVHESSRRLQPLNDNEYDSTRRAQMCLVAQIDLIEIRKFPRFGPGGGCLQRLWDL